MKPLIIFFAFLTFSFNDAKAQVLNIYEIIKDDHKIAVEMSRKHQRGLLSKEEAQEMLSVNFNDYSHEDGKLASIKQFIHQTTQIKRPVIDTNGEQRGWSGSEVYSVQEEGQDIEFFVKVFPYLSKYYLPEIYGLSLMSEVQEVESPKIYACGQCIINDQRYFLLLETPVKGKSIQQYYIHVAEHAQDSGERKQAFEELCEAVYACGKGLAKFHDHYPCKKQSLTLDVLETMNQDLKGAIEVLTAQPVEGIEINKLKIYTEDLIQKMKDEDHLLGLAYNDIKTVHTFYDLKTKTFAFVNPDRIGLSFDEKGELQGLLIKDFCKYILSLSLNRFQYLSKNQSVTRVELLNEEEVQTVIQSFENGYVQSGGVLPNSLEKEYVFFQHDLFFIKNTHRSFPEPELTRVRDLINISLENIRIRLNH